METKLSRPLPIPTRKGLRKLGQDMKDARLRRRISTKVMAQRALISRTTLVKVEKGDAGVSMGIYATVLFILGLGGRLADLAEVVHDRVGLQLEEQNLPKRIRASGKRQPKGTA